MSVHLVRFKAGEWNIDEGKVGMLDFPAVDHLTSMIGTLRDHNRFLEGYQPDAIDGMRATLDCMILCYPVIDLISREPKGCRITRVGREPKLGILPLLSTREFPNRSIYYYLAD
ncbi:MAG: hypothetical protein ACTSUE_04285 [Promethearchaeota archaeon]